MGEQPVLTMVDTELGNLGSVVEAFRKVGAAVSVTTRPEDLEQASAVIVPGVGAFGDGMASLRRNGLVAGLRAHALERRRPLIGICLGMQLLARRGDEHGQHEGLGLVDARAVRLRPGDAGEKVPNIGWCDVRVVRPDGVLFERLPEGEALYFAHSYYLECADPGDVAATIEFAGREIPAAIEHGNVFGLQCHPEKSQDAGLYVLEAFCRYVRDRVETPVS